MLEKVNEPLHTSSIGKVCLLNLVPTAVLLLVVKRVEKQSRKLNSLNEDSNEKNK